MLATILGLHGYYAVAVYNGYSALEQVRILQPDLVISDVVMPGMKGTELALQIHQLLPSCKILLFSGQTDATTDLFTDLAARGHTFERLSKPVRPEDLLARLRSMQSGE